MSARNRGRARPRIGISNIWTITAAGLATALAGAFLTAVPASAAPVYEIAAAWAAGTPASVESGDVVTGIWYVNVNDDGAAPSNDPVADVTFTAALQNGAFGELPDVCLTEGVTTPSSVSGDGATLTCNLGTHDEGTALVIQTPIVADGPTGSQLTASGTIAGQTATLTPIQLISSFGMDIRWGAATAYQKPVANYRDMDFQWSLSLFRGSDPGPQTIVYNLSTTLVNVSQVDVGPQACSPYAHDWRAEGHPWSGGSHPADQMASFVASCTIVKTSPTTFRLTLSGIDYNALAPTLDSTGARLPVDRSIVATGSIWLRVYPTAASGSIQVTSNAPTYTSTTGATFPDDASNNNSSKAWIGPGIYSSAWVRGYTDNGGTNWDATYLVAPGTTLQQYLDTALQRHVDRPDTWAVGMCTALDTRYVTFDSVGPITQGVSSTLIDAPEAVVAYYTGTAATLNPASPSYDPNAFNCGGSTGWSTTPPADRTLVKAVRLTISQGDLEKYSQYPNFTFHVYQTIRPTTPAGTDVWTFMSGIIDGVPDSYWNATGCILNTPGLRYPCTTGFRDLVRIVTASPTIEKSADRSVVAAGVPATFTLGYSANGAGTIPATVDGFQIVDTLPVGMSYVTGSASPAPVVTVNGSGQQVLTWTLNGVATNVDHALTYQAVASSSVAAGVTLTNSATASFGGITTRPATAQVTTSANGFTLLGKTTDQWFIDNSDGSGDGTGTWTIVLRSEDPTAQSYTDTIDILPYNGDGRGTSYSGDYTVAVDAPPGATVYYTSAPPGSLSDDPAHASNGAAGTIAGNTVGWTTTPTLTPTAIRVIAGTLSPGATLTFDIDLTTDGAAPGDVWMNRAQSRAQHTGLVMRTSEPLTMGTMYSASIKKYIQALDGTWHDANDAADYPTFRYGDELNYRIVVTNTGQGTLTDLEIVDDKNPALGSFAIDSLAPGASQTHEFAVTLTTANIGTVNTACGSAAQPDDSEDAPSISCDPAGFEIANYLTEKSSTPAPGATVNPGDVVTYTVTVTQEGSSPAAASFSDDLAAVLDDATYNSDVTASIGSAAVVDGVLSWSGTIPVGEVATISYSVTIKDSVPLSEEGDYELANVVTSDGCASEESCATEHPIADYRVVKTSVPADGSNVQVGDEVEYILTVTHAGTAPYVGASLLDDLSDVLDDATWAGITDAPATGTLDFTDPVISWDGDLAIGQVVTIGYAVEVTAAGDGRLDNAVTSDGCWTADDCMTTQPTGRYTVVKTADPADGSSVQPGDVVTYTVTVTQDGDGPIENASFVDDLSDVLDDATWSGDLLANGGSASFAASTVTWSGDLAVGQVVTVSYSVTVGEDGDLTLDNVVTSDGCESADDCATQHLVGTYVVEKSSDPASGSDLTAGDPVTYTVTVTQVGPGSVPLASFVDDLSGVLDEATWTGDLSASAGTATLVGTSVEWSGALSPGDVVTVTYSVTFTGGLDGRITNIVSSDGCQLAADCITTHPGGIYLVEKAANPADGSFVAEGGTIEYTITVTQIGSAPVDASLVDDLSGVIDDAVWNDDLVASAGTVDYTAGTLEWSATLGVGEVVTITYSVTVTGEGDTELPNLVTSDGCLSLEACQTHHVTGDYTVEKSSDPVEDTAVQVGDVVEYTITVSQSGAGTIPVASLHDDLSDVLDDTTWVGDLVASGGSAAFTGDAVDWVGSLAPGAVVTITYSVTVTALGDGELRNTVTSAGCESVDACETVHETGRYEVVKTADPASGSAVAAGDTVTYTVAVTHFGLADVAATFDDDLSAVLDDAEWNDDLVASLGTASYSAPTVSWSGTLAEGDVVTVTYSVDVTALGDATLTNVVTSDGCVTAEDCTTTHESGRYTISKTSDPVSGTDVQVGDAIEYTVEIVHIGTAPLIGVTVTDDLADVLDDATWAGPATASSGTATLVGTTLTWTGDLALADVVTVTYTVVVTAAGDQALVNQVSPDDAGSCVPAPDGNPDCTTTHETGRFEYSKMADPAHDSDVEAGDVVTYTVTVEHIGTADVPSAQVVDDLSAVLDDADWNADAAASAGSVGLSGTTLTWTGDLADGDVVTITYSVTVTGDGDTTLRNTVTSPNSAGICTTASDGTEDCTTVHKSGGYVYSKTSDPAPGTTVSIGDRITYTLTVTQRGAGAVTGASVTDDLVEVVDDAAWDGVATASSGTVDVTGTTIAWQGDLAAGQVVTISYSVVIMGTGDAVLNNAVWSFDPRTLCDPAGPCETRHVIAPAAVAETGTVVTGTLVFGLLALLTGLGIVALRRPMRKKVRHGMS
jgi:fimbrial isopeptide formation D2 family protein/uncharacterized repeat protein (TIGR01451 family)